MVDYTNEGFTIPIERDGVRGYASIHSLLIRDVEDYDGEEYDEEDEGEEWKRNKQVYEEGDGEVDKKGHGDGLDVTGTYFVYLLHPQRGSMQFRIERDNSYHGYRIDSEINLVQDDIFLEIIDAIKARKERVAHKAN